jgi:hypothetical protein
MIKKKWIRKCSSKVDQVRELLTFFAVSSTSQWREVSQERQAHFRQSSAFVIDLGAVAAWLRQGEIQAAQIETAPFNRRNLLGVLQDVRILTKESPDIFEEALPALCAQAGVAVVFVPAPKGCRASGATQWISPKKALIQLSLRYKTDDHLWFTFFHEAGHIAIHPKKAVFLDSHKGGQGQEEDEANRFAADLLVSPADFRRFAERSIFTKERILKFAEELEIAPGIVVGRLQHEGQLPWKSGLNNLKRRFTWADE